MNYKANKAVKAHQKATRRRDELSVARLRYPFALFVSLMPYMTAETVRRLALIHAPRVMMKRNVPADLQMATFGTLIRLQEAVKVTDFARACCGIVAALLDVPADRVTSQPAADVLGVVNMAREEVERIGRLFQSLNGEKSSDELAAGIDRLDFGTFGIVDWYARRMGLSDHNEVFNTPWQRVYQCAKIDHENGEFEKRYRKILERRTKR